MTKNNQSAQAMKAPATPTLSNTVWLEYNGSKIGIAVMELYCGWLPEEEQRKIVPEMNGIMLCIQEAAAKILFPE